MTGVTKTVVYAILSVGWLRLGDPLLLIGKSSPCSGDSGFSSFFFFFLFFWLSEWCFNMFFNSKKNVLSASLNKIFLSFHEMC